MKRKIVQIPALSEGHTIPILEGTNINVFGYGKDEDTYIEESKYHSNGNYDTITLIGEFSIEYNEDSVHEDTIAREIKYGKTVLNYQIHVYSKEGSIPHFHLVEIGESKRTKRTDTCICLFEPRYFDHGTHVSTLSSKELKVLNNFLQTIKDPVNGTYWKYAASAWYALNPNNYNLYPQFYTNKQPDYTHMLGYKSGK